MALALQRTFSPEVGLWVAHTPAEVETKLNIDVVFTTIDGTLAALRKAADLAKRLSARITLVVPQVVPFPCPLETPPVLLDWNERRFRVLAEPYAVETNVQIYLCRDRIDTLLAVLKPHSIVVMSGRKRWWPTFESKLQRKLRRAGHEVIVAETE
jgi:hypothetical protein